MTHTALFEFGCAILSSKSKKDNVIEVDELIVFFLYAI